MGKGGATGANLKQEEVMESMTKEIGMLKLKNQELNSVVLKVCYRARLTAVSRGRAQASN